MTDRQQSAAEAYKAALEAANMPQPMRNALPAAALSSSAPHHGAAHAACLAYNASAAVRAPVPLARRPPSTSNSTSAHWARFGDAQDAQRPAAAAPGITVHQLDGRGQHGALPQRPAQALPSIAQQAQWARSACPSEHPSLQAYHAALRQPGCQQPQAPGEHKLPLCDTMTTCALTNFQNLCKRIWCIKREVVLLGVEDVACQVH